MIMVLMEIGDERGIIVDIMISKGESQLDGEEWRDVNSENGENGNVMLFSALV